MVTYRTTVRTLTAAALAWLQAAAAVSAAGIDGAWVSVTNRARCALIFHGTGSGVAVREPGGFVISGNVIRGKLASCRITRRVETKECVHLIAKCPIFLKTSSS
jgi:hypothetical protein